MFPWFPFVFPQTYRNNRRTREQISEGAFIEVRVSSGPESIASSDSSFKTETNGSSQLQICYKIRSAEDIRTKTNESILVPNLGSYSTELIDTRKACSSTILRKPVDNLNAQFFCEQSKRQNDLKMNIIERQSSPNDENRQKNYK